MAATEGDTGLEISQLSVPLALRRETPVPSAEVSIRFGSDGLNDTHKLDFLAPLSAAFIIQQTSLDSIVWIYQDLYLPDRALLTALRVRCARYTATHENCALLSDCVFSFFKQIWVYNTQFHSRLAPGRGLDCLQHASFGFRIFLPVVGYGSFVLVSEIQPGPVVVANAEYQEMEEDSVVRDRTRNKARLCICDLQTWAQQDDGVPKGIWKHLGDSFLGHRPTEIFFCARAQCMKDMCDLRNLRLAIRRLQEETKLGHKALYHQLDALVVKPAVEYFGCARDSDSGFFDSDATADTMSCDPPSRASQEDDTRPEDLFFSTPSSPSRRADTPPRINPNKASPDRGNSHDLQNVPPRNLRGRSRTVEGCTSARFPHTQDGQSAVHGVSPIHSRDQKAKSCGTSPQKRKITPGFAADLDDRLGREGRTFYRNQNGSPSPLSRKRPQRSRQKLVEGNPRSSTSSDSTPTASTADHQVFSDREALEEPDNLQYRKYNNWYPSPTPVSSEYRCKRPYRNGIRVPVRGYGYHDLEPHLTSNKYESSKPDGTNIDTSNNAWAFNDSTPGPDPTPGKYDPTKPNSYGLYDDATPSDISDAGAPSALPANSHRFADELCVREIGLSGNGRATHAVHRQQDDSTPKPFDTPGSNHQDRDAGDF